MQCLVLDCGSASGPIGSESLADASWAQKYDAYRLWTHYIFVFVALFGTSLFLLPPSDSLIVDRVVRIDRHLRPALPPPS